MLAYICDSCGDTISNPFKANVREFYEGVSIESMNINVEHVSRKIEIHLCDECFKGLKDIVKNKIEKETN